MMRRSVLMRAVQAEGPARAEVTARLAIDRARIGAHPPNHQIGFGPQLEDLLRLGPQAPAYLQDRARRVTVNHACDPLAPTCGPC
jgi:hypothetical protein